MESLKDLFIKKKKVPIPQQQKQGDISNIYEKTSIWNNNSILQKSQNLESNNYIEHFEKLLSNLNQSGPDFLEFIQTVDKLTGMPLSEEQKYQVTYGTYSPLGVNLSKLIESGNFYLNKITEEENSFKESYESTLKEINLKEEEQINKEKLEIERLSKIIQEKSACIKKVESEIILDKSKLEQEKVKFDSAFNSKVSEIQTHLTKIQNYLNNGTTT